MKTFPVPRPDQRGSTLLVAVVALATLSFLLLSYLNLAAGVNRSVVRSQVWNDALAVAEAGVEEAMINLNINGVGGVTKAGTGWSAPWPYYPAVPGSAYTERWLTYVASSGDYRFYRVYAVTNTSTPTIRSYGFTRLPPAYNKNDWDYVMRVIEVSCTRGSRHPRGMLAKSFINMNGNNITTDSYDSADPTYSTNGRYDSTKTKQNGDIGTNLTVTNSVAVGNANIKGNVATGPGGTVSIGPSGYVTGTITSDMNLDFPDVLVPFTTAPGLSSGTGGYTYNAPAGDIKVGALSMTGNQSINVLGPGLTRIYFTGDFSMTGNAFINVSSNAQLEIYVGGANAKIAGNGIVNNTGSALKVSYFGLPSNTAVDFSGNAEYTGTVYAPNAAFTASGGGNNLYDLAGAVVTKTITLNGHFNLHYDEALGRIPGPNGITITSWKEI